jgi:hypothetical protein
MFAARRVASIGGVSAREGPFRGDRAEMTRSDDTSARPSSGDADLRAGELVHPRRNAMLEVAQASISGTTRFVIVDSHETVVTARR